jgi:hypothetical protein
LRWGGIYSRVTFRSERRLRAREGDRLSPEAADEVPLNALVQLLPRQGLLRFRRSADELLAQPFGQVPPVDRATMGGAQPSGVDSLLTRLSREETGGIALGGGEISERIVLPSPAASPAGRSATPPNRANTWFTSVGNSADSRGLVQCRDTMYGTPSNGQA